MTKNNVIDNHDMFDIYDILDKTVNEIESVEDLKSLNKDLCLTLNAYFKYKICEMIKDDILCCMCHEKFDEDDTKIKCNVCKTFCHTECDESGWRAGKKCRGNKNDMLIKINDIKENVLNIDE